MPRTRLLDNPRIEHLFDVNSRVRFPQGAYYFFGVSETAEGMDIEPEPLLQAAELLKRTLHDLRAIAVQDGQTEASDALEAAIDSCDQAFRSIEAPLEKRAEAEWWRSP
jgi:hypothetical protein